MGRASAAHYANRHVFVPLAVVVCRRQLPTETYQEVSLCLASCISLDPRAFEPALGSLADLAAACFFLPGGPAREAPPALSSSCSLDTRNAGQLGFVVVLYHALDALRHKAFLFAWAGGSQLGQALCRAVEAYGSQPRYQQPLLGMLSCLLSMPPAQAVAGMRGGDADPEAAQVGSGSACHVYG